MKNQAFNPKTTAILTAVVLFLICLFISQAILERLGTEKVEVWDGRIFLQLAENRNFVFSLPLSNASSAAVSAFALGLITWLFFISQKKPLVFSVGYALIIGGALYNLYSRITAGFVSDYFILNFFGLRGAWNLADLFIVIGILLWAYDFIKGERSTIP